MNLIISGASGFLGTNIVEQISQDNEFLAKFDKVMLVDTLQYGEQKIDSNILKNKKFKFIKDSIYNLDLIKKITQKDDVLLHLATDANTFDNPQEGVETNIDKFLKALNNKKISKFIFFSTANVYGINNSDNILETDPVDTTTFYSAKKLAFEALLQVYFHLYNFPVIIFRPVSIFGPHQYPGWLMSLSILRLMKNEKIQITSGGKMKRDWIYVSDVSELAIKCINLNNKRIFGQIYNVGTGKEQKVKDIATYLLKRFKKPKNFIKYLPKRPGDLPREVTLSTKARKTFKWEPKVDFYEGLEMTIDWYVKSSS